MAKNNKNEETEQVVEESKYSKQQLVSSKKYVSNRDLLQVLLKDDCLYTFNEVDGKINEYKKRRV